MSRKLDVVTMDGEEYDELIADKNRLDFIDGNNLEIGIDHIQYGDYREYANGAFPSLRKTIDKMIEKRNS